jgi:hypothetical protein
MASRTTGLQKFVQLDLTLGRVITASTMIGQIR